MNAFSFLIIRLSVGMSMFGHGFVRIPKLAAFATGMAGEFEGTLLPQMLVTPFGYLLPWLELIVGLSLLVGLFTKWGAKLGGIVMVVLIFGSTMMENWSALPSQMIHAAFFAFLIQYIAYNRFAIDSLLKKKDR